MRNPLRPRLGLVLGGGGARGLAHLGVLRVLERAKIPVDLVVGCSMGAMVGTLFAFYQNTADAETRLRRFTRSEGFQRDKFRDLQMRFADVVIHPDVASVHWADFAAIETIIPRGEAAGMEALPAIRAALKAGRRKALARFLGFARKWSVDLRDR